MKTHSLKILEDFADAIVSGDKTFEIRENDKGYQKGDHVTFNVLPAGGINSIEDKLYAITYVLSGWGIEKGYVAFGIKEVDKEQALEAMTERSRTDAIKEDILKQLGENRELAAMAKAARESEDIPSSVDPDEYDELADEAFALLRNERKAEV